MRELVRAPQHDRNRSLGWLAVWWIETFCVHGPGDVQGTLVKLDDEFTAFIVDVYGLDESGRRLYDSAFLSRANVCIRPLGVTLLNVRPLSRGL